MLASKRRHDEGFTLIELLVVVVIIGILIAIAIPLYLNYTKGAKDKQAQSDLRSAVANLEQCNQANDTYPASIAFISGGTTTVCTNQRVVLSNGTSMQYTPTTSNAKVTSYVLASTNSGGNKFFCYNSANAGSVKSVTPSDGTLGTATC